MGLHMDLVPWLNNGGRKRKKRNIKTKGTSMVEQWGKEKKTEEHKKTKGKRCILGNLNSFLKHLHGHSISIGGINCIYPNK
jgi:hypothetical protein